MPSDDERSSLLAGIEPSSIFAYTRASSSMAMENTTVKTENKARKLPQYIAALAAMGGALAAGSTFGWSAPAELPLRVREEFGFPISEEEWSWVGSNVTLGAAAMCAVIGPIINVFGRKRTMLAMVVPFLISWALVIWAQNVAMLLVGRVLLGMSGGAFFVMAPLYIGEIAQKDVRGALGSFFQLMVTCGILFVYAVGYGLSVYTFSLICAAIPLCFGAIFVFMPESPLYLVSRRRTEEAVSALRWLRGPQYDYSDELSELQAEHERQLYLNTPLLSALMRRATRKALFISIGLMFFLQLSGVNIVIFYTSSIFESANTGIASELATIIVGVMQVLATFVASMIVDRVGRRILLLISIVLMALCTLMLGVFFYLKSANGDDSVTPISWLPVFALCLYIVGFSLGFGPITWLMVGELFAPDVKGIAGSAAGSFSWIFAFAVTKSFVSIQAAIGTGETFFMLTGFSVVGTVFVWFVVPETKGKSLAEIQLMLEGARSPDTGTTASVSDEKM